MVAFADDMALVAVEKREEELKQTVNYALWVLGYWLRSKGQEVAVQKTEAVMMVGRKKFGDVRFQIFGTEVVTSKTVKYLGELIDQGLTFGPHVKEAVRKATRTQQALQKLLPKIDGPSMAKRLLLTAVAKSVLLYAVPAWAEVMKYKRYLGMLEATNRRLAIAV